MRENSDRPAWVAGDLPRRMSSSESLILESAEERRSLASRGVVVLACKRDKGYQW